MAQATNPREPIAVVSSDYLSPYPVALTVVNTELSLYDDSYAVNGKLTSFNFKFKYPIFGPRVLLDAAGKPILTFQKKRLSLGTKWIVFRGDSSNSKDILFTTKRSSDIYPEKLDVFMGNEEKQSFCDFKIKGNWFRQSCTIYARDGNTIIAKMMMQKRKRLSIGKEKFAVMVYPNVDQAFIVALVLIMKLTRDIDIREIYPLGR